MFLGFSNNSYATYVVTYIDNNGSTYETRIVCRFMEQEEYFKRKNKGKYKEVLKYDFLGFLIQ